MAGDKKEMARRNWGDIEFKKRTKKYREEGSEDAINVTVPAIIPLLNQDTPVLVVHITDHQKAHKQIWGNFQAKTVQALTSSNRNVPLSKSSNTK